MTLVIYLKSPEVRTYWAISEFETLLEARENLQSREGTSLENIHSLTVAGQNGGAVPEQISAKISTWLASQEELQAVVWTGLDSNWKAKRGCEFTYEDALLYVSELERARDEAKATYQRVQEYVSGAPSQIQVPVRKMLREKLGWADRELASILFEAAAGGTD